MEELGVFFDEDYSLVNDNGDPVLPAYGGWGGKNVYLAPFPELQGGGGRKVLPIAIITTGGVILKKP